MRGRMTVGRIPLCVVSSVLTYLLALLRLELQVSIQVIIYSPRLSAPRADN